MDADLEAILKSTENVELSLGELDDKEFDIPPVENAPTLESILNEPEDDSPLADDLAQGLLLHGDPGETGSISSAEGILGNRPRKWSPKKSIRYEQHGSILRHVVLKGVSAQMRSAADRVDAGMPTALAVASLIAVGTSHGVVLVFDPKQVLKWCLGSTKVGAEYGAVSAISFNKDCTRLLCGFARGQITMWNLSDGKLLRTISDAHPPMTAILNVKFTDDLTIAVSSDSGGSVFELEMKRLIGVRTCESKCLFSGSRGEVCTIEPLLMHHTVTDHPMKDCIVLAMASLSKVIIVTLRPQLKVMFMHPLLGDASTLPLLAWQFVIIQVSEKDRVVDPVLAFARDQTIYFFQVICKSADDIHFAPLQKTTLPYKLLSITWMNSRTMLVVDTSERAHVLDVRSEEGLEIVDITDVQLVYSSSFYKSLATGGNVSKALAYAGERACYQSLVTYNGQLVMLGTKAVHVLTMRTWSERVEVHVRREQYQEALALAASFYEGKAKAVVGLSGSGDKRKALVEQKMLEILDQYITIAMTSQCPRSGKMAELEEFYQNVIPVCVDYCCMLNRTDILFGSIYDQFSHDPLAKATFLECLEPYIIADKLPSIVPNVMQDFVDHYKAHGMVQSVEACIVHMDIASLDIHQVVSLCWAHGLYDALLYIYNLGLRDYTTPLEELLTGLRTAVSTGKQLSEQQIRLGNKLLVYISCCLAGRAYPLGDIPDELVLTVKEQVFECITRLHSKEPPSDEPVYPHLKALLHYDTREFLNVLALGFEDPEFQTEEGLEKRQRVVDIMLQIMVESTGFTPPQIGCLFTFLARQMGKPGKTIMVNRVLFEQVLESLCGSGEDSRHEERQQALMELLQAGGLQHFDQDRLIKLAQEARFYRVCELMFEKRRQYDKILACYWEDTARQHHSFRYIEQIMNDPGFSIEQKEAVRIEAINNLKILVSLDSMKTAGLVLGCLACNIGDIVELLKQDPKTLYDFLQGLFEQSLKVATAQCEGMVKVEAARYEQTLPAPSQSIRHFKLLALKGEERSMYGNDRGGAVTVEPEVYELYIDLMCQYQPDTVLIYIKMADGYRLEETLELVRSHQISDATAYLLEKAGDIQGAFNILLDSLHNKLKQFIDMVLNKEEDKLECTWNEAETLLLVVIQLCQRNSGKMAETDREALWFPLLDSVLTPQRTWKEQLSQAQIQALKDLTRHVLNSMMGYIALPAVLQKIMQEPAYKSGRFGDIKELILSMLDTYNYEKTLLHTCTNLVQHDLHVQLAGLTAAAARGIVPRTQTCELCSKPLCTNNDNDTVLCFRCGHGYHLPCLRASGSKLVLEGEETWLCFLCNSTKRGRLPSSSTSAQGGRFQRQSSAQPDTRIQPSKQPQQKGDKMGSSLEPEQIQAIDSLRRAQKTSSRLAILTELSRQDRGGGGSGSASRVRTSSTSILHNEHFQLRVSHPPPNFYS